MARDELPKGLLASIRSVGRAGDGGRPLEIRLDLIDPDPEQPRKAIDPPALEALAETVRMVGILQPIVLRRSSESGRWIIVMGERRWRAAKLAGLEKIPAYEQRQNEGDEDRTTQQVIENQHRAPLTNTELSNAIEIMTKEKIGTRQIGIICGIPEQQVKLYRAIPRLPNVLKQWADRLDIRTVYELHLAWQKADGQGRGSIEARLAAIDGKGTLTLADARRVIRSVSSVPMVRDRPLEPPETEVAVPDSGVVAPAEGNLHIQQADNVATAPARTSAPRGREGEADSLRSLVRLLAQALEAAADALDATDRPMAEGLRRRALEAKERVDDGGNPGYTEAAGR